jgi:hypothetical protein
MDFLKEIVYAMITALTPIVAFYLCKFLQSMYEEHKSKIKNETVRTVLGNVTNMIASAVTTTTSTYVKHLKADNIFDAEAQKHAFNMTYDAVTKQLTEESKQIIEEVYGDIETYLTNKIEELVENLKNK